MKARKDYEELKEKVAIMQDEIAELQRYNYRIKAELQQIMDNYFADKCMVVMIKRDRREIVAEIHKRIEKNLIEGIE